MNPSWQLRDFVAALQLDRLGARVDLRRPGHGLFDVRAGDRLLEGMRILGVAAPPLAAGDEAGPIDHHVRGVDLVTAYSSSPQQPLRVHAMWRAVAAAADVEATRIELIVSVRTELLESDATLTVESVVPCGEVLHLVDAEEARYQRHSTPLQDSIRLTPSDGPSCVVFRLPKTDLSYVEMVHPVDFRQDELRRPADDATAVCLRHQLFSEKLEKGVILRCRLAGFFVPRDADTQTAAACHAAFAASSAPLNA